MTNIQNLTSIIFYATVVMYATVIFLTVFIYKDYRNGFIDSTTMKFNSKFEAIIYYVLSTSYLVCLMLLGALIYILYTTLFAIGAIL
ncbi:hypothetical protein G17_00452 [Escherichia phage vB_EcoM_G17]|nr:hypothetical protein G17_00452 [Escherichia phage vB_EcoM_G17]QXN76190.1 hypothetical protein [Escherichia phage BF17]WNN14768.1 hypothetical protein Sharanji_gp487 [Escherichia phage Sharanji]